VAILALFRDDDGQYRDAVLRSSEGVAEALVFEQGSPNANDPFGLSGFSLPALDASGNVVFEADAQSLGGNGVFYVSTAAPVPGVAGPFAFVLTVGLLTAGHRRLRAS